MSEERLLARHNRTMARLEREQQSAARKRQAQQERSAAALDRLKRRLAQQETPRIGLFGRVLSAFA